MLGFLPANSHALSQEASMAKRRYQDPTPERHGKWWTLLVWRDDFVDGKLVRTRKRERLALLDTPEREVRRLASEHLRPMNQGLEPIGSLITFERYVRETYIPLHLPHMATSSQGRTRGVLKNGNYIHDYPERY
jgi:hypothetical protein